MQDAVQSLQKERSLLFLLAIYVGVLTTVLVGVGYAFSQLEFETPESSAQAEREKTILDQRIASSREVKAALSRAIPPPEPLGPIKGKRTTPAPGAVASAENFKKSRISLAARNAMAMEQQPFESQRSGPATYDRAALGGW
jgi:hypothetical protein